jgi:phage gp29-like protein
MTTLFDQFGREIQVGKKPEMRQIAVTAIRDRWSQYPSKGLTPEKLASILVEADQGDAYRQAELFEEMEEKDAHLFSEFQKRKNAVLSFDYEIQPFSESAEDKKIAEFLQDVFFNLPKFEDAMLDLLDAIPKGFALIEPIYDFLDNRVVISDLSWIHQKRAVFYDRGAGGIWQKTFEMPKIITEAEQINGEIMPPFKLIYHRHKARSGYDTRAGIMRVCAWMYLFKNYSIKDWVAFAEIFGMPLRLGKYDSAASKEDKDSLITAIQSLGTDAAGVISKNTEIEFVESVKSTSGTDNIYSLLANFCDKQMSKAILGQTLTTQEGDSGSYALGKVHNEVRQDLTRGDSEALSKTIRFQAFRPLVGWNFGWDKPLPWFKIQYEPSEDLKTLSEVYKNVSALGQPISQEHVSERFKIPLPGDGETVLEPPASSANPFAMRLKKGIKPTNGLKTIIAKESDQNWISFYMESLAPSLKKIKGEALQDIEAWLRSQSSPPSETEFISKIQTILGGAYKRIDKTAITESIAGIYQAFKAAPGAEIIFGGADIRAINFFGNLDHYYLSKFIDNPDAQAKLAEFLKARYLEGGEGLFGAGDPAAIKEMQNLLAQQMTDLEGYQINRIADTGVQRVRNWAHISQLNDAGIAEIEIIEPTQECPFCAAMNGKIIQVNVAYRNMVDQANMTPEEYQQFLENNPPSLEGIEDYVDQGMLPPYHPHCRGTIIKRLV